MYQNKIDKTSQMITNYEKLKIYDIYIISRCAAPHYMDGSPGKIRVAPDRPL